MRGLSPRSYSFAAIDLRGQALLLSCFYALVSSKKYHFNLELDSGNTESLIK